MDKHSRFSRFRNDCLSYKFLKNDCFTLGGKIAMEYMVKHSIDGWNKVSILGIVIYKRDYDY